MNVSQFVFRFIIINVFSVDANHSLAKFIVNIVTRNVDRDCVGVYVYVNACVCGLILDDTLNGIGGVDVATTTSPFIQIIHVKTIEC